MASTALQAVQPHLPVGHTTVGIEVSVRHLKATRIGQRVRCQVSVSEVEGKVDVKVEVKEEDPERFYVTLDNSGTKASGKHRVGVSYQNANIGNGDQVLTLAYTTAVDPPGGMKILSSRVFPWQDIDGKPLPPGAPKTKPRLQKVGPGNP